jgi:hypothetical protein
MGGLFTVGAMALAARRDGIREADERERQRQREDEARAQANEERQLRQALLLKQLEENHVVPNDQRETVTVGGSGPVQTMGSGATEVRTPMRLPDVPNLITGHGSVAQPNAEVRTQIGGTGRVTRSGTPSEEVVDPSRYRELGTTGFSLDTTPSPSYADQRKLALQKTMIDRRIAAMKAKHPERYGKMTDQELVGIASDDEAYRESLKDVKPDTSPTFVQDGSQRWDPTANGGKGALVPTGLPPRPRATPASATPEATKKNDRDALQDRINIITQQITQLQTAIEKAPYTAQRDTSQGAVTQRAAIQRMRDRMTALQKEQEQATQQLEQYSKPAPAAPGSGAPLKVPEGLDLSLAVNAAKIDQDQAQAAFDRITKRVNGATLEKAMQSMYLSPAAKAIIWKRATGTP